MVSIARLKEKLRAYRKVFQQNWDLFKASKIGVVGIIIMLFFVGMAVITPFLGLRDPINWRAPDADIIHVTSWWGDGRNVTLAPYNGGDPINHSVSFRVKLAGGGATEVDRVYFTSGNKMYSLTPLDGGSYWDDGRDIGADFDFPHLTDSPFSTDVVVSNFGDQYDPDYADFVLGVGTYDGYIYIIDDYADSSTDKRQTFPSGDRLYIEKLDSSITSAALFSDKMPGRRPNERFYFGTDGGYLYAYSATKLDNEDWSYFNSNQTWIQMPLKEGEIKPSPRTNFSMAYDSVNDKIVVFGGYDGLLNDETWIYDPVMQDWTRIDTDPHPSARYGHSMAFDSSTGEVVLFGGIIDNWQTASDQTWTFSVSDSTWTLIDTANAPSARAFSAMSFDNDQGFMVLFGGDRGSSETWVYADGVGWTEVFPTGTSPFGRYGHAMAYDSTSNLTVLFGGSVNGSETWTYNSSDNSWTQQFPLRNPSARKFHAMAYDEFSNLIVLYGGDTDWNQTWTYDVSGNAWNEVVITSESKPEGRYGHSMVYDSTRNEIHIFGGDDRRFSRLWYRHLSDDHPIVMAGSPLNTPSDPNRSPAITEDGSLIFVNDGGIRPVRSINSTDAWDIVSIPMGGNLTNPPIVGLPSIIGPDYVEAVYATTNDGWIYARYASNGSALAQWEELGMKNPVTNEYGIHVKIDAINFDDGALTIPDISDDVIYFGSSTGHLYAIRRDSTEELPAGSTIWVYSDRKLLEEGFHFTGGVKYVGSSALLFAFGYADSLTPKYVGDDVGYLLTLGPDGFLSWRKAVDGRIGGTPSIHKDNVGTHPTPSIWFGTSYAVAQALSSTGENRAPLPPGCYASGNCYTLGTDAQGRDIFSQLMWGSQIALTVGLLAALGSIGIGTIIGLVAGYSGGRIDSVLMRFTDVILVLPGLPFLIILAAVLGPSYWNIIFVLTIIGWPGTARVIRSEVLSLKERPFIDSARVTGASNVRIMFKHLAPNVMPLAFLYMTLAVSGSILSEAALSFLGLGDVNTPSWGQMLQAVQTENVLAAWWWLLPPGLAITFISLAFYLIGRAFEQIVNPRLRKR